MGSVRLITVIAFVAAIVLVVATPGSSWAQQPPPFKHDKLSSILAQLVNATQSVPQSLTQYAFSAAPPQPGIQAYLDAGLMSIDGWEQIQVYIHVTKESEAHRFNAPEGGSYWAACALSPLLRSWRQSCLW